MSKSNDPVRTFSEAEDQRLAKQLRTLTEQVYFDSFRDKVKSPNVLVELHSRLFDGVREHAGRTRADDFGSETLTFGPNRSCHRSEVHDKLAGVFGHLRRAIMSFDENPSAVAYEQSALTVAAWAHAEIVRIHPFEDGNGRVSRLFMNVILMRVGLRPIAMEVPKQEYRDCLNHYFLTSEMQPLVDLMLGIAFDAPDAGAYSSARD